MALPLDPTQPAPGGSPGLGDDQIRALKQWLVDVLGVPVTPTAVALPGFTFSAGGLTKVHLQSLGSIPASSGELAQHGSVLYFHDGTAPRLLLSSNDVLMVPKLVAQTSTGTSQQLDAELILQVRANTFYQFEAQIYYSATASGGLNAVFAVPGDASLLWNGVRSHGSVPFDATTIILGGFLGCTDAGANVPTTLWVKGVVNVVTAGVLQFSFSQATAVGSTSVLPGSIMQLKRLII